jgi:hypothetical protein
MEAIRAGQKFDASRRMDWDKAGSMPYRDFIKFRWCAEIAAEKAANEAPSGSSQTIYSKETIMAGG